jgi:hypothetical protein
MISLDPLNGCHKSIQLYVYNDYSFPIQKKSIKPLRINSLSIPSYLVVLTLYHQSTKFLYLSWCLTTSSYHQIFICICCSSNNLLSFHILSLALIWISGRDSFKGGRFVTAQNVISMLVLYHEHNGFAKIKFLGLFKWPCIFLINLLNKVNTHPWEAT